MPIPDWSALVAYTLTIIASVVVGKRSSNWRIRLLAWTIGFLPVCQSLILLRRNHLWIASDVEKTAEMFELLISALCLTSVHLLNKENIDRKSTDARLRVAEGTSVGREDRFSDE